MSENLQFDREEFAKLKRQTWDATNYGSWFKPARGQVIDTLEKSALEKALAGRSYEEGLDVGIGNGRLLPIYAPHVARVTGMDISAEQLERATQAARELKIPFSTVLCQEASRIEVEDASFDLVICSRVLQHVYNWRESIAEFARILKPNGELVLLTYNRYSIYGLKKYYQHKFVNPTKGRFQNALHLSRELKRNHLRIEYFSGALMGQPELFAENMSAGGGRFVRMIEGLSAIPALKYFGGRLVIRARKVAT